jgi:hypothetical protein
LELGFPGGFDARLAACSAFVKGSKPAAGNAIKAHLANSRRV